MRVGDTVLTPDGYGIIVGHEDFKYAKRYGVELQFPGMLGITRYYFENELSEVKQ